MRTLNQHCIINYTGREPKKEHVHGDAWVNHVAVCLKQRNTLYNTVSHLHTNAKCKLQKEKSESRSAVYDFLWWRGLYSPWNSPGQNTGVGSLFLLQGIFSTQGSKPGLPHCRQIIYQLSHKGSPRILEWVAYPFSRGSSRPRHWTRVSGMLILYPSGLSTWAAATSLKPEQVWVPWMACLGAEGGGEDVPANEPAPRTWRVCFPLHRATTSRSWWVLLQWNHLLHPKDVEPLGWKSFGKSPDSHLQLPSLGSAHLWWEHPPQTGVAGIGMCPGQRGKKEWDTRLGCFF